MSDMSTYLGNKVLRWLAGNAMPSAPAAAYAALFNGDPKGAGTEITTDVLAAGRLAITFDAIASGTDNTLTNSADVDFGDSDTGSLSVSHVGIYDAQSGGNLLFAKAVTGGPFAVEVGTLVKFLAGDLDFTVGD